MLIKMRNLIRMAQKGETKNPTYQASAVEWINGNDGIVGKRVGEKVYLFLLRGVPVLQTSCRTVCA